MLKILHGETPRLCKPSCREKLSGGYDMGYTKLSGPERCYDAFSLEGAALTFLRDRCEGLRFSAEKTEEEASIGKLLGTSLKQGEVPYNQQMDVDRLCLETALKRFLRSGRKEDAFDVYFCYLEMFVGDYKKTRRMIELLSEFEANGSGLLMKHRDHYAHSVYVFALGLAIYQTNEIYRNTYQAAYHLEEEHSAACHFLRYWGLTSLFHDIGYPFELPFEQVASYFEIEGDARKNRPFVAYQALEPFVKIPEPVRKRLETLCGGAVYETTNELFAGLLAGRLGAKYGFTEAQMLQILCEKPTQPDRFNHFMDHAYFSATTLFKKLFCEMDCPMEREHLDALTGILTHNSLYKFSIAHYKDDGNTPLEVSDHPLAYMLMLCDELQCWDRTAYGRNSKRELHPMGCRFDFSDGMIRAFYLYDEQESGKIKVYQENYAAWQERKPEQEQEYKLWKKQKPGLKAYAGMYETNRQGISSFQEDIERIVDLSAIRLQVETELVKNEKQRCYLSDSSFLGLYNFAIVLNARWDSAAWKHSRELGQEEQFLLDEKNLEKFSNDFQNLSLEYQLSNINQAKAFARYMQEINCFYTDRPVDFALVEHFSPEELKRIGPLEHQRWLQEHYDMGWTYGTPEKALREQVRQHWDMIPDWTGETVTMELAEKNYHRLNQDEQLKDTEPMECMLAMLRMFDGLRIYRLH